MMRTTLQHGLTYSAYAGTDGLPGWASSTNYLALALLANAYYLPFAGITSANLKNNNTALKQMTHPSFEC